MTYYLYKKTHRTTGLQYLGKTKRDPYDYKGSGKHWTAHINKHGNDVETEVLLETEDHAEITKMGLYYSELWDVVKSKKWANLKVEQGDGGWDHMNSKLTKEEYSRRGKLGKLAQDKIYIQKYGDIKTAHRILNSIGLTKAREVVKEKQETDPKFRDRHRKNLDIARAKALSSEAREKKKNTFKKIGHSQGVKNSQFGTCWIYNAYGNKKIKKAELDIYLQQGYTKGRKL